MAWQARDQLKLLQTIVWSASEQTKNFTAANVRSTAARSCKNCQVPGDVRYGTAPVASRKEFLKTFVWKLSKLQELVQKTWLSRLNFVLNIVRYRDSVTFRQLGLLFFFKKYNVKTGHFVLRWKRCLTAWGFSSPFCIWRRYRSQMSNTNGTESQADWHGLGQSVVSVISTCHCQSPLRLNWACIPSWLSCSWVSSVIWSVSTLLIVHRNFHILSRIVVLCVMFVEVLMSVENHRTPVF
jgi:hypothetical protein